MLPGKHQEKTLILAADANSDPSKTVHFFVVGPGGKVFKNDQNLPLDAIQSFEMFEGSPEIPFRFA